MAPQHRRVLETWIEDWARARGVLPVAALDETYDSNTFAGLGSPRGAFDFVMSQMPPTWDRKTDQSDSTFANK